MDTSKLLELINKGEDFEIAVFTKVGADKRKISREELLRLFQDSGHLTADEMLIPGSTIKDLNYYKFDSFFEDNFYRSLKDTNQPIEKLLENLNLFKDGKLNLAGLLLFGVNPQRFKKEQPDIEFINDVDGEQFIVKIPRPPKER